jgi:hypothetical protein
MLKRLTLPCHSFELPYSSDQKRVTGRPSTYRLYFFTKHYKALKNAPSGIQTFSDHH